MPLDDQDNANDEAAYGEDLGAQRADGHSKCLSLGETLDCVRSYLLVSQVRIDETFRTSGHEFVVARKSRDGR